MSAISRYVCHGGLSVLCLILLYLPGFVKRSEAMSTVETAVTALQIKGQKPYEKLDLRDLDVLILNDSTRSIPLRRMLTATGLFSKEVGDTLFFMDAKGRDCWLTVATSVIRCSGETKAIAVRHGVSDVTGQLDFYLPESAIDSIFDVRLTWDEAKYSYFSTTTAVYPVWRDNPRAQARRKNGHLSMQLIGVEMPEMLPPSGPWEMGDPSVHFFQPGIYASRMASGEVLVQKTAAANGRLAGGRWGIKLRQSRRELSSAVSLEEFSLTHRLGDFESTIGDVDFGMSDLVFPHLRLSGWEINGLTGLDSAARDQDRSEFGREERYLSQTDIRGSAPLGSKVELFVGERFIDEQKVEEPQGAAGEGIYRFSGINLARDRLNTIRVVTTEPDGKITERTEDAVGATSLLQKGQASVIVGAGSHRFTTQDFWAMQGKFYGGRLLYGVTPFWTIGLAGAYQNLFSLPFQRSGSDSNRITLGEPYPSTSYHAGLESRVMLFKRHLLTADFAASRTDFDRLYGSRDVRNPSAGDSAFGARARLEVHISNGLRLQPEVFRYDPGFFDGTSPSVQDRQGYVMAARTVWGRVAMNVLHGQLEDNIRRRAGATHWESWQHVDVSLARALPRTALRLSTDRLEAGERSAASGTSILYADGPWTVGAVNVTSTLLRFAEVLGQYSTGTKVSEGSVPDLRRGLALPYSTASFQHGWNVSASRPLMENGRLTLTHDVSIYRKRTSVTHVLRSIGRSPWQWRVDAGFDWDVRAPYLQLQPEFYLESSGSNRVSAIVRYLRHAWAFSVGVQIQPIFSFVGGRPSMISHSRISPGNGGVKGVVFLDENGNGRRDDGEPGVPDINVLAEGGRHVVSGPKGDYVISASGSKRRMRVTLDSKALAANYTATNGAQWANVEPGTLTPVNLGIVEPGSISGFVMVTDPLDNTKLRPQGGVRVVARDSTGATKQESITYTDGSFYLGGLMPAVYTVDIDPVTLPKGYTKSAPAAEQIRAGNHGQLDLTGVTLRATYDRSALERENKK